MIKSVIFVNMAKAKAKEIKINLPNNVAPHSIDSEVAVIGAMLLNKKIVAEIISQFSTEKSRRTGETKAVSNTNIFYDPRHQAIYDGIVELFSKNIVPDVISLTEHLLKMGKLEEAGGTYYITEINTKIMTYANYQTHCRIVKEYYFKRSLIEVANTIIKNCYDYESDAFEVIDNAEAEVFRIAEERISKTYKDMQTLSDETKNVLLKEILEPHNTNAVSTGYRYLDNKLNGGLTKSDLIILAARPSMGKSAFALALAYNAATQKGGSVPVGFFSLEMSARQLVVRLLNLHKNLFKDEHLRKTVQTDIKELNDNTKAAYQEVIITAFNELSNLPIYFDDTAAISIMELRAKCRQMKAEKNIGLIIVDYLQLIRSPKAETREREIAIISSTLKQIARELDIPVLALAQLNRVYESRVHDGKSINAQKTPILSDLRESGSIEQDADVVMFVHRPEALLKNDPDKEQKLTDNDWRNLAQIVVEKHRNGDTGMVDLNCFIEYGVFTHKSPTIINNMNISQNVNNISSNINIPKTVEDIPF